MIPASYFFKGAYRGAWGTAQVETPDERATREARKLEAKARGRTEARRPPLFLARPARLLAIALYRWSEGCAAPLRAR